MPSKDEASSPSRLQAPFFFFFFVFFRFVRAYTSQYADNYAGTTITTTLHLTTPHHTHRRLTYDDNLKKHPPS